MSASASRSALSVVEVAEAVSPAHRAHLEEQLESTREARRRARVREQQAAAGAHVTGTTLTAEQLAEAARQRREDYYRRQGLTPPDIATEVAP